MVKIYELKCNRCGFELKGTRRDSAFSCKNCKYFKFFESPENNLGSKEILLNMIVEKYRDPGNEIDYFFYGKYEYGKIYLPFWYFLVEIDFLESASNVFKRMNGRWSLFFPAFKYSGYLYFGNVAENLISYGEMAFESDSGLLVGVDSLPFCSYIEAIFLFLKFIDRKEDITDLKFDIDHLDTKIIGFPFKISDNFLKSFVEIRDEYGEIIKREIKIPEFTIDALDDILDFF